MSDRINHECGIALVRLLKPLEFYLAKYGTSFYGLKKLHLMMQKQHNRGQDGAGIACIKFDLPPGNKFMNRIRSGSNTPIDDLFKTAYEQIDIVVDKKTDRYKDVNWLKDNAEFTGELFLGHLRYGTFGKHGVELLHPVIRHNSWKTKNLILAGNFNLTNVDELIDYLIDLGQYPTVTSDTITLLEKIGHYLDVENERLYLEFKEKGFQKREISPLIAKELDIQQILTRASKDFDGGYAIVGLVGHGDAFVMRDPSGIRPAYYYHDDEIVVAASERPVIQTTFDISVSKIKEIEPGNALIVKKDGKVFEVQCKEPMPRRSCSFERIYFSRGTDVDIYQERKNLGKALVPSILKAIDYNLEDTVFSFIPNTAAVAFRGLVEGLDTFCDQIKKEKILQLGNKVTAEAVDEILRIRPRTENVAVKDIKLRTFITQEEDREDLVGHVYDITYGSIRKGIDNLVVIDDSIVRGTTLRKSIIRILDRLGPKKIIIASSAPQIRYPDCYGIDMAKLQDFIAFQAAIELIRESHQESIINEVYKKSKSQENYPKEKIVNYVREIYKPFTADQISARVAKMLSTPTIKAEVTIIYQSIEDLHLCCPNHTGDWYFTGDYPTPGGNKVVNRAFINYIKGKNVRAY